MKITIDVPEKVIKAFQIAQSEKPTHDSLAGQALVLTTMRLGVQLWRTAPSELNEYLDKSIADLEKLDKELKAEEDA